MRYAFCALAVLAFAAVGVAGEDPKSEFEKPVAIKTGDVPIDMDVGHAAPFFHDMDGDGLRDLLVGQMGKGQLRIYKNVGDKKAPRFDGFELFRAEGEDATVPTG